MFTTNLVTMQHQKSLRHEATTGTRPTFAAVDISALGPVSFESWFRALDDFLILCVPEVLVSK